MTAEMLVKKIDGTWKVVMKDDETCCDATVSRGDRIRWTVEGSDASFQFSDDRLFGDGTRKVRAGNPMVLPIGRNVERGTYPYSVFIHNDMEFAIGQSPPRIIIQ